MKLVVAIFSSHRLEDTVHELDKVRIYRKTVTPVLGVGESRTEVYRGVTETGNLVRKIRLDIAVNDDQVETTIAAILKGASENNGDGKIFVIDLLDCIRIDNGSRGPSAIGQ